MNHFKKITFIVAISAIVCTNTFAQANKTGTISTIQGDALEKVKFGLKENAKAYLGKDVNGNMLFYSTKQAVNMAGDDKITETLVAYDAKMHVVKRTPIKNEVKKKYNPIFFLVKNKIYFFPKSDGKNPEIAFYEFDTKTATMKGTPIATAMFPFTKNQDFMIDNHPFFSPDSSLFAIRAQKSGVVHFKVFDANLKEVGSSKIDCGEADTRPSYYSPRPLRDAVLDNQGNIYGLKRTEIDKKAQKTRMITSSISYIADYTAIKLDKTGKLTEQILSLENKHLSGAKMAIAEDVLVVGALYSENIAESIGSMGFALLLLDTDLKTMKTTLKPVSHNILKKGKDGKKVIDGNSIEKVVITKNHIFLVNNTPQFSEDFYTTKVVALFTDIGNCVWVKEIEQMKHTIEYGLWYYSVVRNFLQTDDAIVFLHEDHKTTRETSKYSSRFGEGISVITSINTKGEIHEQTIPYNINITSITPGEFWESYIIPINSTQIAAFGDGASFLTIDKK